MSDFYDYNFLEQDWEDKEIFDAHKDFLSEYLFSVTLGGYTQFGDIRFSKISGIEKKLDYEEIYEGGYNESPHLFPIPHKQHAALVLEKGAAPVGGWINQIKPGMRLGTWMTVALLDITGKETKRSFTISDGIVTKWDISGLNALGNSILIERLEIMHEGITYQ